MHIKKPKGQSQSESKIKVEAKANRKLCAQVVYKSGAIQNFQIIAVSVSTFGKMQRDFKEGPLVRKQYVYKEGSITIDWADVSSFTNWKEDND